MIFRLFNKIKLFFKKSTFFYVGRNFVIGNKYKFVNPRNISIDDNFTAGNGLLMQSWPEYNYESTGKYNHKICIGKNVSIMSNCHISCVNEIKIGDGCLFGDNVFITDNFHGNRSIDECEIIPIKRKLYSKGPVIIGKNVWIGRNVCVMPNVTIGDYAIIGANSVVTHDIPSRTIAAGCPAKIIKYI